MRGRTRRHRQPDAGEMNVTAFMNLMVALVPFLLILAVFSRITIVELSLPDASNAASAPAALMQLEVIVRDDRLIVSDRLRGVLREIPNRDQGYDLGDLSQTLRRLKNEAPQITQVSLLLEPQVAYEQVVSIMDVLRVAPLEQDGETVNAALFPDISVGDAPLAGQGS